MPQKISKMTEGSIGSRKCEISLCSILIKENNAKYNKIVMSRYDYCRRGCDKILKMALVEPHFATNLLNLWRDDQYDKLETRIDFLPKDVYTHLRCCMKAEFTETMRKICQLKKNNTVVK